MGYFFAKSFSVKPRRLTRHISSRLLSDESLILAKVRLTSMSDCYHIGSSGVFCFFLFQT
ncbi:unnamed protein product, partial [Brassica oleracea var. botrytis]